jgi:hypothetical protein
LTAIPEKRTDLSEMTSGTQGFSISGIGEILNIKTISSFKAIKFQSELSQHIRSKVLQDDRYQLFLKTNPEDKDRSIIKGLIYLKRCLQILDNEEL